MADRKGHVCNRASPFLLGLALVGCGDNQPMPDANPNPDLSMMPMPDGGGGLSFNATPSTTGGDFDSPLDSVPDSSGKTFYFTASHFISGVRTAAVYSVPAAGGSATLLADGAPLTAPFGIAISSDDKTLYVADAASGDTGDPSVVHFGAIYSLPVGGGMPAAIAATSGFAPRGLDLAVVANADTLYFSGTDPADGKAGLFTIAAGGGTVKAVAKGFGDPSGVAVEKNGGAFVADTIADGDHLGKIVLVAPDGTASDFVTSLAVGFPTGIALSTDEKLLLVSALDPVTRGSVVFAIDTATKSVTSFNKGIAASTDSGGLHRARAVDVLSWCGVTAGGSGVVYQVKLN